MTGREDGSDEWVGTTAGFASRALAISIDTAVLTIGIGVSTWVIRSFADLLLGPRSRAWMLKCSSGCRR